VPQVDLLAELATIPSELLFDEPSALRTPADDYVERAPSQRVVARVVGRQPRRSDDGLARRQSAATSTRTGVRKVSANVAPKAGEAKRRLPELNVRLNRGFTLTHTGEERRCEARCEADTALITQRSQVQILPPLQGKTAGQSRVRGSIIARLRCPMSARCPLTLRPEALNGLLFRRSAKAGERRRKHWPATSSPLTQRSGASGGGDTSAAWRDPIRTGAVPGPSPHIAGAALRPSVMGPLGLIRGASSGVWTYLEAAGGVLPIVVARESVDGY
jgi:hypothetical protein